jgi:hypothetical protein
LVFRLQIDADPDPVPAYHFDADPDSVPDLDHDFFGCRSGCGSGFLSDADADPDADPDTKMMRIYADPDPQH